MLAHPLVRGGGLTNLRSTVTLDIGSNDITGLVPTTLGQLMDLGKIVACSK